MARFYGPIQQNPGGGEIIEIEPTALPTDAVILTNPVEGATNQEDANQYFYAELANKSDVDHTHGTDENGEPIDTSNLVTKTEFEGSQQTQDDRLTALESSGPGTGYDDTEVRSLIQGNTDALDDKSDTTHTHPPQDTTHTHDEYLTELPAHDHPHDHSEYADAQALADHLANHPSGDGGSYDDTEVRGLIQDNTDALANKSDTTHTHDEPDLTHNHDGEYQPTGDYATTTDLTNRLATKSDIEHTHDGSDLTHNHDGEYQPTGNYATTDDLTNRLATKSDIAHTHEPQDLTHNHFGEYAGKLEFDEHAHDEEYQPKGDYALDNHTHPPQDTTHDHDNDYAGKVHAHDEYASSDDVTALWVLANSNEAKANANTSKNTEQDGRLDALEAENGKGESTIYYQNTNSNIYQDGRPGNPSPTGWQGWHYASAGDGTKINWYFYAQDFSNPEVFTGELNSFALLVVPESSSTRLPYVTVYTMPQGDGQDAQVWYRSRLTYENTETSFTANQPYVLYYGENPEIWENYPRKQLSLADYTSEGPQADGEGIFLLAIGSDSSAAFDEYNFTLQQSHIDSVDYVQNAVFLAPTTVEAFLPMGQTTYVSAEEIEVEIDSIKGRPGPKSDTVMLSDYDEELIFDDELLHSQHDANEFFYRETKRAVKSENVLTMTALTQDQYDAMIDPDPNTLYLIVEQDVVTPEPDPDPEVGNQPSDGLYMNAASWSNGVVRSDSLNPGPNQIKFNSDNLDEMNTVTFHKDKSTNPRFDASMIRFGEWFIISQDTGRLYGEFTSIIDDARDTLTVEFTNLEVQGTEFQFSKNVMLGYFAQFKVSPEQNVIE